MKLILTGATGFVGRNSLIAFLKTGRYSEIWLPVRSRTKLMDQLRQEGISECPELQVFETADEWQLPERARDCAHVVHCAGVIFARTREQYWQNNVAVTQRLLEQLQSPERVVILSSLAAGGPSEVTRHRVEDDPNCPVTWYGKSKLEMEGLVRRQFQSLPVAFLRPPMVFGPRDHATLPLFKMMKKPLHFKAGLMTKRYSFIGVGDLVSAIDRVLTSPAVLQGKVYYVAHPDVLTDWELLRSAATVTGCSSRILPVPQALLRVAARVVDSIPTWRATIPSLSVDRAKEIWPRAWVVSSAAFESNFGWRASEPFLETLSQTYAWYQRQEMV